MRAVTLTLAGSDTKLPERGRVCDPANAEDPMSEPPADPSPPRSALERRTVSVRNVAASYAGSVVEAAVFLLLTPFLIRELGLAAYGLWGVAVAMAEWLQLLDLGLREGVVKYVATHQARSAVDGVRRTGDTALFVYCLVAGAASLLGVGLAWLGLPILVEDPGDLSTARGVLLVLTLSTTFTLPANLSGTILEGLSRFDLLNLFRVGHAVLRLFLIVLALQLEKGLLGVAVCELVARMVLHLARWTALRRVAPNLVPRPRPHRGEIGRLFGFASWNAVRQGAEVLLARIYEPLLAAFAGMGSVGAFLVGRRVASIPTEVIVPMTNVLLPLSSELEAASRENALRQTLMRSTKISLLLALPLALAVGMGAEPIQNNWLGGDAPEAVPIIQIFSVLFVVVATALPAEVMLLGLGFTRLLALTGLAQTALVIGLGIPMTRGLGAVGLAFAALVAVVSVNAGIVLPVAVARVGIEPGRLLRGAIGAPLLAAAPVAVVMYYLRDQIALGGLAALAAWAGGAGLTYALLLWWFGFDREERSFLRSHVNRLLLDRSRITDWDEPE